MVNIPDLSGKTLFLVVINLLGLASVSAAVIGTIFGNVQLSFPLYIATGVVWVVALLITAREYLRN